MIWSLFKWEVEKLTGDYLSQVTSKKDQQQYWFQKNEPYRYVSVKEFSDSFQSFHVGRKLGAELSTPFDKSKSHPAALTTAKYGISKIELLKACISREWLLMNRNSFVYVFKIVQVSTLSRSYCLPSEGNQHPKFLTVTFHFMSAYINFLHNNDGVLAHGDEQKLCN